MLFDSLIKVRGSKHRAALLGSASGLALAALGWKSASAATSLGDDATQAVNTATTADYDFTGTGGSVTIADGQTLTGSITTQTTSENFLVFTKGGTVTGNVGTSDSALQAIDVGADGSGLIQGSAFTYDVNFLDSAATFEIGGSALINGAVVTSAASDASSSILTFGGSTTVTGDIANSTTQLGTVTIGATGTSSTIGNVFADQTVFSSDGSVTLTAGTSITGSVTNTVDSTGTLVFAGANSVTGDIGDSTHNLASVVGGANNTASLLSGDTYALTVNFSSDGTIQIADTKSITGSVTTSNAGSGFLEILVAGTVTGDVGTSAAALAGISVTGAGIGEFDGDVYASLTTIENAGTVQLATGKSITGSITSNTDAAGGVLFAGDGSVTGDVGNTGSTLAAVNVGVTNTTVNFGGDVYATTLLFSADGSVTIADGKSITGAVDNSAASTGTLTFAGSGTVTGAVGANGLSQVNAGVSGSTVLFQGDVSNTTIDFASDGTVTLLAGKTIAGTITSATSSTGTLLLQDTTTVSGDIGTLTTIDVAPDAGTAGVELAAGNITASTINISSDGTLALTGAKTITATITTSTNTTGVLQIGESLSIVGNVGSSSAAMGVIDITNATASPDATITGNVAANAIAFNTNGNLTITGASTITSVTVDDTNGTDGVLTFAGNTTVSGSVGAASSVLGVLNLGSAGSEVTLSGDTFAAAVAISGAGTVNLTSGKSISGTLASASGARINVLSGTVDVGGNVTFNTNDTLAIGITDATTSAQLSSGGSVDMVSNTIDVVISTSAYVANGQTFQIIDSTGGVTNQATAVTDNSSVLSFATSTVGNTVVLTATRTSGGYAGASGTTDGNNTAISGALESAGAATATGDLAVVLGTLDSFSSTQLNSYLESQDVSGGVAASNTAATSATGQALTVVGTRLAAVRGDENQANASGMSTGEMGKSTFWMQAFGTYAKADQRSGDAGYRTRTGGVAVGADTLLADAFRGGLAFAYARTGVDMKDQKNGDESDIDSYVVTLYGSYTMGAWYVDPMLTFGLHKNDAKRNVAGFNTVAEADYDAKQYTARIEGGYRMDVGNAWTLTPLANLTLSRLKTDGYAETGAAGNNLTIDDDTSNSIRAGFGARLATNFQSGTMRYVPEFHAQYIREFKDDAPDSTSRYSAGGSSFTTSGAKQAKNIVNLGTSLSMIQASGMSFSVSYDAEVKEDYQSHTGTLRMNVPF